MIAVDTNVLVRFLVRDDEKQAKAVFKRFKKAESGEETLFVPLLVIQELIWVLQSAYDKPRASVLDALDNLRRMPIFAFENDHVLQRLQTESEKSKADLPDLLIALSAQANACNSCITFDKKASKIPFFQLLK